MLRYLLICCIIHYFNCTFLFSQVKQVIVIGIDGMGSHGIRMSHTPVMDSIMKTGAYTLNAKAVFPTLSSPNWASMTKGVNPQYHRITSNDWEKKESNEKFPSIFKVIRENDSLVDLAVFHQWKGFSEFIESDVQLTIKHAEGEVETIRTAIDYLSVHKPVLTFLHLDHVDHQGHLFGEGSREYKKSL